VESFQFSLMKTSSRLAFHYPAQVKPPFDPHPLLDELPPLLKPPKEANTDTFFFVFSLLQDGQACCCSASEKGTTFSNSRLQSLH